MAEDSLPDCVVYWLFDERCICPWRHGYVGISRRWKFRLRQHVATRDRLFEWKILFEGTSVDCLNLEAVLRPAFGIGWNVAPGGAKGGGSNAPKTEAHKLKIQSAALRRYADPAEKIKTQAIVKKAFVGVDRSGSNNSHFGISVSAASRQRISEARKGKGLGNENWKKRPAYSEEARKKMSEASRKRWRVHRLTEET